LESLQKSPKHHLQARVSIATAVTMEIEMLKSYFLFEGRWTYENLFDVLLSQNYLSGLSIWEQIHAVYILICLNQVFKVPTEGALSELRTFGDNYIFY